MNVEIIVHGLPMTTPAKLLAAMVIRLGGCVELTPTEIKAAEGLILTKGERGFILEANTDPIHGILGDSIIK